MTSTGLDSPNDKAFWRTFLIVHLALGALLALRQPYLVADSASYLQHSLYRPPLVPLLVEITRFVFRGGALHAIVLIQMILSVYSTMTLARVLSTYFKAPRAARLVVFYLLFLPGIKYGCTISSESLSYTFFLWWTADAIHWIEARSQSNAFAALFKYLLRSCGWCLLSILTRTQFVFLLPFVLLAIVYTAAQAPRTAPRIALVLTSCTAILVGGSLLQNVYHYLHGAGFQPPRAGGAQLLTILTYVSQRQDVALLTDPEERRFMEAAWDDAAGQNLLAAQLHEGIPRAHHLNASYAALLFGSLTRQFLLLERGRNIDREVGYGMVALMSPEELKEVDVFFNRLGAHMLRITYRRVILHMGVMLYEMFKFYLALIIALGIGCLRYWKRGAPETPLLLLLVSLWVANLILLCLVEYPMTRYTFYTDAVFVATIACIVYKAFAVSAAGAEHDSKAAAASSSTAS